ncbi:CinA family protein [Weissella confusa]|uniref:CinA family protein n=1 Tax=Weissella confusa TaxID=1583 RepID=A0A923NFP9_WEICO|nr:CinA family protein [Weissella confusa]
MASGKNINPNKKLEGKIADPKERQAALNEALKKIEKSLSFTGVAGPDALEGHPAGTVFIGIAAPDGTVTATKFMFDGDRQQVRDQSVAAAFDLLADKIKQIAN